MSISLQVLYPISDDSKFDFTYYTESHFPIVGKHWGSFIESITASKGIAGGPDTPPAYHAIASLTFKDMDTLEAAIAVAEPVLADIANFTNVAPEMLIGEVLA
ncbi:MAG: ethyl tert-butyl ether degradation protein EthD [Robiginitomaculum sp.]|nr:MAG: ethyl tert-butyl ether degradation protein EthD [Robiginitomaculum sp.]